MLQPRAVMDILMNITNTSYYDVLRENITSPGGGHNAPPSAIVLADLDKPLEAAAAGDASMEYPLLEDTEYYLNSFVIPALAVFGVIGNVLNLAVLTCRYMKRETDSGEKGALRGLIALAVSDMFFCVGVIPSAFYDGFRTMFHHKSVWLYYQMYQIYYQNIFIKTSTTLTMTIALGRYFGICHPLTLRHCARLAFRRVTICLIFLVWVVFNLPLLWMFQVFSISDGNATTYIIDIGEFSRNHAFKMTFTYLWAIIGYFVPLGILGYCNIQLVRALRRSQALRQRNARYCNVSGQEHRSRITVTLIALTSMYILLVSPSEILHFYMDTVMPPDSSLSLERAVVCTNVLQAVNFSCHFILYCIVNASIRSIVITGVHRCFNIKRHASWASSVSSASRSAVAEIRTSTTRQSLSRTSSRDNHRSFIQKNGNGGAEYGILKTKLSPSQSTSI